MRKFSLKKRNEKIKIKNVKNQVNHRINQKNTTIIINKNNNSDIEKKNICLVTQINNLIFHIEEKAKYIASKIIVQRAIAIGFLIKEEELRRNLKFSIFWKEIAESLKLMDCKFNSRSVLFEARRLYLVFSRFTNIINDNLSVDNISIPLKLSKTHLLLIAKYCHNTVQQDIFIEKVVRHSLNCSQLKSQLLSGVKSSEKDNILTIDDVLVKSTYDLSSLNIESKWKENKIRDHIIKNIPTFITIVLGYNWAFIPNQNIFIGGRVRYLDLVFYNVITHRYLIIDLKCSCLVSDIDRAKSQMISYIKAYDSTLDLTFQKPSIGLILGKNPIDGLFFNSTITPEFIFYSGFNI